MLQVFLHFGAVVGFDSYLATNPLETCRNLVGFVKGFRLMGEEKKQRGVAVITLICLGNQGEWVLDFCNTL